MRKLNALFLSVILVFSIVLLPQKAAHVQAASDTAKQVITALGIMNTDKGDYSQGTKKVNRAALAQMLVNLSQQKGKVSSESNVSPFGDVSKKHWAAGYIQTAVSYGWMSGYLNGSFKPDQGITLREAVNGVLKLLGYTNSDFTGNVVGGQMAMYTSKGLNENISKTSTSYLTVNDCINLFYNTLTATTKEGKVYAETLGYSLNANGDLDYLSLVNIGTEGPIIADGDWKSEIPFSSAHATYYKNGSKTSSISIQDYDVLYYSESLNTIWVYEDRITGTVESINPDQMAPQSVTVSGKEYTLGTSEMSIEFSTLGSIKKGDFITLLLGKDGSVAGVLDLDEYNATITGIVTETGNHLKEDELKGYVNSKYVIFVDAAGNVYQQDYDETKVSFVEGSLVRVTYKDGEASVSKYELGSTSFGSNTFNSEGSQLGSTKLASNVKILDFMENQYISVYPERLAGVTINSSILYYELNKSGEISQLILNNVTGDMYEYGIYNGLKLQGNSAVYEYLIDGTKGSLSGNSFTGLSTQIGPQGFKFKGNELKESFELLKGSILAIGETTVSVKDTKFTLAADCDVYFYSNGEYTLTNIEKVSNLSKYELTAYYNKAGSLGGRVRIIVAKNKA